MGRIKDGSPSGRSDFQNPLDSGEKDSRDEQEQAGGKQPQARFDSTPIWMRPGSSEVPASKNNKGKDKYDSEDQMNQEHPLVKGILELILEQIFSDGDGQ